jgi:hypothetical protein
MSTVSPPRRTAPFEIEPGYYEPANLWLYGNARLLQGELACIETAFGAGPHLPKELGEIEREAERLVLAGKILVCGIHSAAHQRAALVPLRWGAPRIVVFSGGFRRHLGKDLREEPFRAARLWRYQWDHRTDLAVSRRAPEKLPTYATHNRTVDRLIGEIAGRSLAGLFTPGSLGHTIGSGR